MSNSALTPLPGLLVSNAVRILYLVGFSPWWGNYPPDILDREDAGTVAGGEAGALNTAFQLGARGHEVHYCSVALPGTYRGVRFHSLSDYVKVYATHGPWDAVVSWSSAYLLQVAVGNEARLLVQQLNDLAYPEGWDRYVDAIISPSVTHAQMMVALLTPEARSHVVMHVVGNGFDPRIHPADRVTDPASRPMTVGWWSSPDRGLHHLLRVWPEVKARVPEARLRIFYKVKGYLDSAKYASGRAHLLGNVLERELERTRKYGVELVDMLPRKKLADEQRATRVQAYPLEAEGFVEGYACSVLEALASGCLPILRPKDALPELWNGGVRWVYGDPLDEGWDEALTAAIVWGLTVWAEDPKRRPSLADMRRIADTWTWEWPGRCMENAILHTRYVTGNMPYEEVMQLTARAPLGLSPAYEKFMSGLAASAPTREEVVSHG